MRTVEGVFVLAHFELVDDLDPAFFLGPAEWMALSSELLFLNDWDQVRVVSSRPVLVLSKGSRLSP